MPRTRPIVIDAGLMGPEPEGGWPPPSPNDIGVVVAALEDENVRLRKRLAKIAQLVEAKTGDAPDVERLKASVRE
jgi:hypothetical protein